MRPIPTVKPRKSFSGNKKAKFCAITSNKRNKGTLICSILKLKKINCVYFFNFRSYKREKTILSLSLSKISQDVDAKI